MRRCRINNPLVGIAPSLCGLGGQATFTSVYVPSSAASSRRGVSSLRNLVPRSNAQMPGEYRRTRLALSHFARGGSRNLTKTSEAAGQPMDTKARPRTRTLPQPQRRAEKLETSFALAPIYVISRAECFATGPWQHPKFLCEADNAELAETRFRLWLLRQGRDGWRKLFRLGELRVVDAQSRPEMGPPVAYVGFIGGPGCQPDVRPAKTWASRDPADSWATGHAERGVWQLNQLAEGHGVCVAASTGVDE